MKGITSNAINDKITKIITSTSDITSLLQTVSSSKQVYVNLAITPFTCKGKSIKYLLGVMIYFGGVLFIGFAKDTNNTNYSASIWFPGTTSTSADSGYSSLSISI